MKQDLYLIFFEMYKKHRKCSHMHMECIPLPKELGELGPMYFKVHILLRYILYKIDKQIN